MINKKILQKIIEKAGMDLQLLDFDCNKSTEELLIFNCIFSHKFAKAFFGLAWRYHLKKMVLEKEPIEYLEKFYENINR